MIKILGFLLLSLLLAACRGEEDVITSTDNANDNDMTLDSTLAAGWAGMYVLNEGNMGSNKATVDYLDLQSDDGQAHYYRNIYPERNPSTVKELGDVGNDIKVYGSKVWIVVNASNKVEVCKAASLQRITQVDIPNPRYLAFQGGYAYVSSYAGPIQLGDRQQGRVYKVDTLTMQKVDSVVVGRQPEELAFVDGLLYVANSGGYTPDDYDNTVSVVDVQTMTEQRQIEVAINLHRLRSDDRGQLWVSSRGDYNDVSGSLWWLTPDASGAMAVGGSLPLPVSDLCIVGDTLYYIASQYSDQSHSSTATYGIVDVSTHSDIATTLFRADEVQDIETPYGIIVNPIARDYYLMDAKNYVSSGEVLHFSPQGTFLWRQWTGDIPGHAAFVSDGSVEGLTSGGESLASSAWIAAVDEYVPAPGQFVNTLPQYEEGADADAMARKCTAAIAGETHGVVSLGGFGGYITFHFDHAVENVAGENDLYIMGNSFIGSAEPGIVMVAEDTNGNGQPDDEWYELMGSADVDSVGKVRYGYSVTYTYNAMQDVPWTDSDGNSGSVARNTFHTQEYFPLWLVDDDGGTLTLSGTRLPSNAYDVSGKGTSWTLSSLAWGYVDNLPSDDTDGCSFNIDNAVEPLSRNSVTLRQIHFVRVYSAMNQQCGWLGETSTEICGARDLHW